MRSKVTLIAAREYNEFVRTKTFWIGIISFPVLFGLAIFLPRLLEKAKDVRKYTVVDESRSLLAAVEARAALPDFEQLFFALKNDKIHSDKLELSADEIQAMNLIREQLSKLNDEQLKQAAEFTTQMFVPGGLPPQLLQLFPKEVHQELPKALDMFVRWYKALVPKQSGKAASGLSKSRYQKIDYSTEELGSDPLATLNKKIESNELFAYFVIGKDPVTSSEGCKYVSNNLTDESLKDWFSSHATTEVRTLRMKKREISEEDAEFIQKPLRFEDRKVSTAGEEKEVKKEEKIREWAPVGFVYLLWIAVFTISQMLLTNTIEEKSNRIIEVLLSSVSPFQLMAGKISGIAATGLTVIGSWVLFFFIGVKWVVPALIPEMPRNMDLSFIISDPVYLASFVLYFMLGYLLYAALLVGLGSVCNSLKEAQNLMQPVFILLMLPLLSMVPIGQDPNGPLARVLSYIPFFTPFVMMNRSAGPPSLMEYVLTTALLVATIAFCFWAAAKVFRIGILMTGKPPKIKEILRWIRAPVGIVPTRSE